MFNAHNLLSLEVTLLILTGGDLRCQSRALLALTPEDRAVYLKNKVNSFLKKAQKESNR